MENAKERLATRTLIAGIIAPLAAAELGTYTYRALTRASTDRDSDFVFRLGVTAAVMAIPFLVTCAVAFLDKKRGRLGVRGYVGLGLAVVSLALIYRPIQGGLRRAKQAELLSLEGVPAPPFETVDLEGATHRLADTEGKVVLINIWATWCPPCRKEMPELDKLYQDERERGLVVYGLSTEDIAVQRKFVAETLSVSYPLLTIEGNVPEIYRTTARYPANYLIDRKGRLTPAPSTDQPFENLTKRVEELLAE
jgi:cytochrome c biogenesis protein CcmG, thiol:disulfide interchange protein DsbE